MDAWLVASSVGVSVILDVISWRTGGFIFALVGGLLTMFTQGSLMANQAINVGNVVGACTPGGGVGPNCGYNLPAADVQFTILLLAVFTVASFLLVYTSARKEPAKS